jgi:hypothetical protein
MVIKLSNKLHQYILQLTISIKAPYKIILLLAIFFAELSFAYAEAGTDLLIHHNKELERTYENVKRLQNEHSTFEGALEISEAELTDLAKAVEKMTILYDKLYLAAREGNPTILDKMNKTAIRKKKAIEVHNKKREEVDNISIQVLSNNHIIENAKSEYQKAKSKEKLNFESLLTEKLAMELAKVETPVTVERSATAICSRSESLLTCEDKVKRLAEQRAIDLGAKKAINTMTEVRDFQLVKDDIVNSINAKLSDEVILKSELIKASPLTYEVKIRVNVSPVRSSFVKNEIRKSIITELSTYRFIGDSF